METCFGMNKTAILALSIFFGVLTNGFMWRTEGKMLPLQPSCIPGTSFPTINCLNSLLIHLFGVSERTVAFCGYDRDRALAFDLVPLISGELWIRAFLL